MQYEYKTLEEKMRQLPTELQEMMASVEISNAIKEIGNTYNLKLDQEEALYDQTAYVILRLSSAKDFVKNFSDATGINEKTAAAIATDLNKVIFDKIRKTIESQPQDGSTGAKANTADHMPSTGGFSRPSFEKPTAPNNLPISSFEHAGDLKIEPEITLKTAAGMNEPDITGRDRSRLINGIENPMPLVPVPRYEPLPDQLLQKPASIPEQEVVPNMPPAPVAPKPLAPKPPLRPPSSPDPYREAIQ